MGSKNKKEQEPRPLKEASILVVEDHTFVLDLLERMLKPHVGGLHAARSGEDAFYNLEKSPGLAHVVIVDYHLKGMNGLKFIEKLRNAESEILNKLPVVMLTGDNNMDLYRAAARLGIAAFLVKPVALANLTEALERALAGGKVPIPRLDKDPVVLPSDATVEVLVQISEPAPASAPVEEVSTSTPPPRRPLDVKA